MLSEICAYLRNYFDRGQPKYYGKFRIVLGEVFSENYGDLDIKDGQYFRIMGSVFNDGVWRCGDNCNAKKMEDEEFEGTIWLMAVPRDLIELEKEIQKWQTTYGSTDAPAMSPYNSESFGGYSYSKSTGSGMAVDDSSGTWQGVFKNRLKRWKKL